MASGLKLTCRKCGTRFYENGRVDPPCPCCGWRGGLKPPPIPGVFLRRQGRDEREGLEIEAFAYLKNQEEKRQRAAFRAQIRALLGK